MPSYLPTTLERLRESNNAGACYLQLVPVVDIDTFPEEVRGTLIDAIALLSGKIWFTVTPTKWTQAYDEAWQKDNGGATFSRTTLACVIPKDREELLYGLWQLHRGRFVVLHYDLNKKVKVLGTKEEPAMVNVVNLRHGSEPGRDRNQYELQVTVTRRSACPFYLADPPNIGTPDDCPTLAELIAAADWSVIAAALDETQTDAAEADLCETLAGLIAAEDWAAIQALLSPEQLEAAEAAICTVPSLCELLDAAFAGGGTPENSFTVTGAGSTDYNLQYTLDGTSNGKDAYRSGTHTTSWSGTAWVMLDEAVGTEFYQSTDDTEFPWEATGWTAMFGIDTPAPTLTQDGGGGLTEGAEAIADCLTTEQGEAVVEALGGAVTCDPATVQLRDSAGANIGSADSYASGSSSNKTAPDGTIKTTDGLTTVDVVKSNGATNLPQSKIKYTTAAGGAAELAASNTDFASGTLRPATTVPRFTIFEPDGTTPNSYKDISTPSYTMVKDLVLAFEFFSGDDTSLLFTVRATGAGSFTATTNDGSSGTITFSKNGGAFAAFSAFSLAIGDLIQVKRTTTTANGWVELTGSYT